MSAQHTPGPWQQYHDEHEPFRIVGNVDGEIIEGSTHHTYDNIVEEVEGRTREIALANARLIAAAPELLEALQRLVGEELGGDSRLPRNDYESYRPFVTWHDRAFARAAIAKATGAA